MNFLERDLEEIIENADREALSERGLYVHGKMYRQLRIGNYGVADLVTFNRVVKDPVYPSDIITPACITVYELKKDKVGISAFLQAVGYLKGIKRYLDFRGFDYEDIQFRIVLIGSSIDTESTFSYLSDLLPINEYFYSFLSVYKYSIELEGLTFEEQSSYKLTKEGFTKKLKK